jgi:hypothetical protein
MHQTICCLPPSFIKILVVMHDEACVVVVSAKMLPVGVTFDALKRSQRSNKGACLGPLGC